ncbi:bifunctional diguanylate cyclase/phosphodiesterase [Sphingomonas sp.]|uniref:putative bifunctional diguanylate cyclase/phosphodiesterase n=1 Tax=Sphingomonas sp. TaxID=28214 RepID=UPI001DD3FECE|nr:bifunctional diguanylate cyclase/phosphodiesterase [Sphingomonas sp.]MBX9796206.1 bifunctional diguanylate cyclase/phosphodiesterase [Sphingomonas sp.]
MPRPAPVTSAPDIRARRRAAPVPPVAVGDTDRVLQALELLPIPALVLRFQPQGLGFEAYNSAFVSTGLGTAPERSRLLPALAGRFDAFIRSGKTREEFAWRDGEIVECRYYRVHLARAEPRGGERCLVTFIDQTAELRTEQNLRREMLTDSLSGLPNRAGFGDLLEQAMAGPAADGTGHAVMIVNLNRFSRVNACLGSLAGDELLITVARRIRSALRANDVLARTGGDEFGILLTIEQGESDARHVAKRIQAALASPFRLADYEIRVSCSIGIAFVEESLEEAEDLIRRAQFAVKRSKATGLVETYQLQAFDQAREEFGMETALRRAIDGNRLRLAFQPIWDLATGRIVAFEALARWPGDPGAPMPPNDFIPVAEESGLIVPLGRWALREAAQTLARWDARAGGDCGVKVAVNISAIQLQRDNVPMLVEEALAETGLAGERLTLELTESALVGDAERVQQTMQALKRLGTHLAMDDFGTGYSNLALLQKLPIDVLKMDRSFVTGMLADRDKVAIVRAIMGLALALGMKTTAEGIETPELAQTLAALGCSYGQGFHYAQPLDADSAFALLQARNA